MLGKIYTNKPLAIQGSKLRHLKISANKESFTTSGQCGMTLENICKGNVSNWRMTDK